MNMPQVKQEFYELKGGIDQVTPPISLQSGKCLDSQNFEPEISGGYKRIDGYERFDGRTSPTSATYSTISITVSGSISVGDTITGATSSATGKVLLVVGSMFVVGRVTGTFVSGENVTVSAVIQGVTTSAAAVDSASSASDDADWTLLAANDRRNDIQAVPGSGRIRGVWVFNDVIYAFRDNVAGTAGAMYKSTTNGWVQVTFATEIYYSSSTGGTTAIAVGDTIGNAASPTKTATVLAVLKRSGTWGTDAVGSLVVTPVTGSWSNSEDIYVGATKKAVSSAAAAQITRAPGGSMEFDNGNFTGSTATKKMFGCDGINPAFSFDGTTYVPIHTGMTTDAPSHIRVHRNYLFLSFLGSVQFSAIGDPYAWSAVLGAGEIATGDNVTGFLPQGGSGTSGSSMAIFTSGRTHILYGSGSTTFQLVTSIYDIGYSAFTCQPVSNNTFGLTSRGVQSLITTLTYGDFDYESITHLIQPLINSKRGMETASVALKTKNQYRLYFNDGTGLIVGLTGDSVSGIMPINYVKVVRCITNATLSTGAEVTYFGSDDGYVYCDNTGTSFDGNVIESWVRPVFNHSNSPQIRKRYRRAVFEVKATGYAEFNVQYDLGYGTANTNQTTSTPTQSLVGGGAYWEKFTWESFSWDAQIIETKSMSLEGTEKNISFLFYSNRAQDVSYTIQGVSLMYSPRRMER